MLGIDIIDIAKAMIKLSKRHVDSIVRFKNLNGVNLYVSYDLSPNPYGVRSFYRHVLTGHMLNNTPELDIINIPVVCCDEDSIPIIARNMIKMTKIFLNHRIIHRVRDVIMGCSFIYGTGYDELVNTLIKVIKPDSL